MSTYKTIISLHKSIKKGYRSLTPLAISALQSACQICHLPHSASSGICLNCMDELPWQPPGCRICQDQISEFSNGLCLRCRQSPPDFSLCRAALSYQDSIPGLIHKAKDNGNFPALYSLAKILSDTFCAHYSHHTHYPEVLLPVPLHVRRLGLRGFNQSLELCKILSKQLGTPILSDSIIRRASLAPQKALNRRQRLKNEGMMFSLNGSSRLTCFKHIAIIDDVVTTGSTARELASILRRQAKVPFIDVWAIARSNSPDSQ